MKNLKIGVAILLLIVGCGSNSSENEDKKVTENLQELPLIERFSFEDLEGNKMDWSSTKGKVVFINYWATWCRPCIKEMPSISNAYTKLKDDNIVFIIASDEEVEKIKKFEAKHYYNFQFTHSNTSVFELDIQALPTTMIINKKGEIVFNEIGVRDWSSEKNIALIKSFSSKQ